MPPTLGYWDVRGLGQPIRMLLHYCGEDFEDKRYTFGPAPEYSKDGWLLQDKTAMLSTGYDFPNLPYYQDGDIKISQSGAILRHIARKHDMCGTTEEERLKVDMVTDEISDFRKGFLYFTYQTARGLPEQSFEAYYTGMQEKLQSFETFLGDRHFLVGSKPTFADFIFYEMLHVPMVLKSTGLDAFPKLKAYVERFKALPAIKAVEALPESNRPLCGPMANYGGSV